MGMMGQVSLEFMIVYSALLMICLIGFFMYYDSSLNFFQAKDALAASQDASSLAAAINYVYLAGDGTSYEFAFPQRIDGANITISDYAVTSQRAHASGGAPLLSSSVNVTEITSSNMTITNSRGVIGIAQG